MHLDLVCTFRPYKLACLKNTDLFQGIDKRQMSHSFRSVIRKPNHLQEYLCHHYLTLSVPLLPYGNQLSKLALTLLAQRGVLI